MCTNAKLDAPKGGNMEWIGIIEILVLIGGIATIFGLFLAPMFYLGSKIDSMREEMYQENKDFHGRLCAIEERRNK